MIPALLSRRGQLRRTRLQKRSEKSWACSWRSHTGCPEAPFWPISCSVYQPNSQSERCSNPFRTVSLGSPADILVAATPTPSRSRRPRGSDGRGILAREVLCFRTYGWKKVRTMPTVVRGDRASQRPEARETDLPGALQHVAFALPDEGSAHSLRRRLAAAGVEVTDITDLGPISNMLFRDNNGLLLEATWARS
jgi:hypothetical protein